MAASRHQKSSLNKAFIFIALTLLPTFLYAETVLHSEDSTPEFSITDIDYSYELFCNNHGKYDCRGTLKCLISIPENAEHLIFERTNPHPRFPDRIFFDMKYSQSIVDETLVSIEKPDIRWNTYFRACILFKDGSRVYSPIYPVKDFIQPNDLDILTGQSHIDAYESDSLSIFVKSGHLYIGTNETTDVSIFDIYGKCLFSDCTNHSIDIPLDKTVSPFIIIKCETPTKSITKKLIIQ